MSEERKTVSVGGQAVMEGIMFQGPEKICLAVRTPDGGIHTEVKDAPKRKWGKIPLVRGVLSFIGSMFEGYKMMMRSAELSMGEDFVEEEPTKFDLWVEKHFGEKATKIVMAISVVLGLGLAVGLFVVLPTALIGLLGRFVPVDNIRALLEGLVKILLFVCYLVLVRNMKEIHRVFSYHGAEHKTIACYEAGDELTVENVRPHTRFHPRCSTSYLLIVLIISILVNSLIPTDGTLMRVGFKLLLLPLVMGISFEILRFTGRHDNWLTRILRQPGMWLQRVTTNEPADEMIEVAIASVNRVLPGWVEPEPVVEAAAEEGGQPALATVQPAEEGAC